MTSSKYTRRLAALLMASAAILPAQSPSALASVNPSPGTGRAVSDKPATMSEAEYRALMLRSDALNEKYGLGDWAGRPATMSKAEFRALILRGRGLNERYGALRTPRPAKPVAVPTVVADGAFAWRDFGIGAAAMLGGVLLASGLFVGSRRGVLRTRSS
jgi:hypothetical protein